MYLWWNFLKEGKFQDVNSNWQRSQNLAVYFDDCKHTCYAKIGKGAGVANSDVRYQPKVLNYRLRHEDV